MIKLYSHPTKEAFARYNHKIKASTSESVILFFKFDLQISFIPLAARYNGVRGGGPLLVVCFE